MKKYKKGSFLWNTM